MNQITIRIKDKDWIIKQSFRSYLLFEEMTNKQIGDVQGVKDVLTLMFCSFKGCNKEWNYSFDEFIDFVDDDPNIINKFNEFNNSINEPIEKKRIKKD